MHIMNVMPNTTYFNTHSIVFSYKMQSAINNPLVAGLLGGDIKSKVDDRNKTKLNRHWKRFVQHPMPEGLGRGESVLSSFIKNDLYHLIEIQLDQHWFYHSNLIFNLASIAVIFSS